VESRTCRQAGIASGVESKRHGNDRFYVIALIIQTLLADIAPDSGWGRRLKNLFNEHPTVNLRAMQFPAIGRTSRAGIECNSCRAATARLPSASQRCWRVTRGPRGSDVESVEVVVYGPRALP